MTASFPSRSLSLVGEGNAEDSNYLLLHLMAGVGTCHIDYHLQPLACITNVLGLECSLFGPVWPHQTLIAVKRAINTTYHGKYFPANGTANLKKQGTVSVTGQSEGKPQLFISDSAALHDCTDASTLIIIATWWVSSGQKLPRKSSH